MSIVYTHRTGSLYKQKVLGKARLSQGKPKSNSLFFFKNVKKRGEQNMKAKRYLNQINFIFRINLP